ncbi:MAG: HPr family phosphocarrier protein [Selenomonadaceae bacterium]|nr:HPr family phosphocarrier protein [Selenomonadaceae bacterium]
MTKRTVRVENETGFHARPASIFVREAEKFRSKIEIHANGKVADAKDLVRIMSMQLSKGTEVLIQADGMDESDAVESLARIIKTNFGDE